MMIGAIDLVVYRQSREPKAERLGLSGCRFANVKRVIFVPLFQRDFLFPAQDVPEARKGEQR